MYSSLSENGLSLADIVKFTGGTLFGASPDKRIFGISTDSRKIAPQELFVAISGERFDGHMFLSDAKKAGAVCALTEKVPNIDIPYILTGDTIKALGAISKGYYSLFPHLTVGITGSVGKTTTKEFIYAVLSEKFNTAKTAGNLNNEIGLPKTLLSFDSSYNALVLEMGMSARGEISRLSNIAHPDIAVITNIGSSHLENLLMRENIALAKLEITDGMESGTLILNGDEPLLENFKKDGIKTLRVGLNDKKCDIFAYNIEEDEKSIRFSASLPGKIMENVEVPVLGRHNVYNALYAISVGTLCGMDEESIRAGLMKFAPCDMRGGISEKNGFTIIEDCYNASPESMKAALKTLNHVANIKGARKLAFLGDMRELGCDSGKMHFDVGKYATECGVDILITFGKDAENIAAGALSAGMRSDTVFTIQDTENTQSAVSLVKSIIKEGDVILFKASRALSLERISRQI